MDDSLTLAPRSLARASGAVVVGGGVGTMLRDLALQLQSTPAAHANWLAHVPWILLAINAVGVYVGTVLLAGPLRHHGPNTLVRLLLITGFLGGFTSYSSLFVALAAIWHLSVLASVAVGSGAVVSGAAAAGLGLLRWPR